jgi:hypothetical protein
MNLTPILNAFIALCAALITAFVIPWLKKKNSAQGTENLLTWVNIAVTAAEQLYTSKQGTEKKLYVLNYLASKGYTVNTEDIENAIEATVLSLHNELYGTTEETA